MTLALVLMAAALTKQRKKGIRDQLCDFLDLGRGCKGKEVRSMLKYCCTVVLNSWTLAEREACDAGAWPEWFGFEEAAEVFTKPQDYIREHPPVPATPAIPAHRGKHYFTRGMELWKQEQENHDAVVAALPAFMRQPKNRKLKQEPHSVRYRKCLGDCRKLLPRNTKLAWAKKAAEYAHVPVI